MSREYSSFRDVINDLVNGKIYTPLSTNYRKIWIPNCYHFTNLDNAVSVIKNNRLISRNAASSHQIMSNENASTQVISGTDSQWKDFVRLYFRPKTPTQFNNEGIRSEDTMSSLLAHCAVPIFFLFDLESVLTRPDSWFSETSLAKHSNTNVYNDVQKFSQLPFEKIYHDQAMSPEERNDIVAHRHAEIIVKGQLPLNGSLKNIIARSKAEAETLLYMLDEGARNKYGALIKFDTKKFLYYGRWFYINDVKMTGNNVHIMFNVGQQATNFRFSAIVKSQNQQYNYYIDPMATSAELVLSIPEVLPDYEIEIYLNNHLAYKNRFIKPDEISIPY